MKLKTSNLDPTKLERTDVITLAEIMVSELILINNEDAPPMIKGRVKDLLSDLGTLESCL